MALKAFSFVFLLAFFLYAPAFAQTDYREGYLLTLQNDTIPGLIKYQYKQAGKTNCLFKASEASKPVTYTPEQLNGYGFRNGERFVSSYAVGYKAAKAVFMEYLVGGRISLYFYRTPEKQQDILVAFKDTTKIELTNTRDTVFYENSSLKIKGFKDRYQYRGQLKALMEDRQELFTQIERARYNTESIAGLVAKYNAAFGSTVIPDNENLKPHRVRFGIMAATGSTHLQLSDFAYQHNRYGIKFGDFNNNSYYALGAVVNVQLRQLHEKISFQVEPSIARSHYGSDVLFKSGSANVTHNILDFDITALRLPVSLKYAFYSSRWKMIPFVRAGIAHQRFLQADATLQYTVSEPTSSASGSYSNFDYADFQNSVFVCVGTDIKLKKNTIAAEVILDGGDGIHKTKYQPFLQHSWTRNLFFQVAYLFD